MNNLFKNIKLSDFNRQLDCMVKKDVHERNEKQTVVNNIRLLAASDTSKLSVTIKPDNNNVEKKDFYFGLHPSFDDEKLITLFNNINLHEGDNFWKIVESNQKEHNYFSLGTGSDWQSFENYSNNKFSKECIETLLLGRSILRMATHLGIELIANKGDIKLFSDSLNEIWQKIYRKLNIEQSVIQNILDTYYKIDNSGVIKILGIWPEEALKIFDETFQITYRDSKYIVSFKNRCQNKYNEYSLNDVQKLNLHLVDGSIYYSGVLPRTLEINYLKNHTGSNNIKYISMIVQRTTYATVDMLDNPLSLFHLHIINSSNYYDILKKFDEYEDNLQKVFLYKNYSNETSQSKTEQEEIRRVNQYLKKSLNTHGIAVSANIVTQDDYLIIGKRDPYAIDNGEYYPSANGQAEFVDENVQFYQMSVYEDLPTLNYDSSMRLDLNYEIQREALAELGIGVFKHGWNYYGLSYLSINNLGKNTEEITKRRMHFNVLTSNQTRQNFAEVVESQKYATESFESIHVEGIKLNLYSSIGNKFKDKLRKFVDYCYQNMGIATIIIVLISTIFSLLMTFLSDDKLYNKFIFENVVNEWNSSGFEFIITILILIFLISRFISDKEIWKLKIVRNKRVNTDRTKIYEMFEIKEQRHKNNGWKLNKYFKPEKKLPSKRLNPVTRLLYALHYLEKSSRLK